MYRLWFCFVQDSHRDDGSGRRPFPTASSRRLANTLDHVHDVPVAAHMDFEDREVYLTDYSLFDCYNKVYFETFKADPKLTRITGRVDNDRIALTVIARG